MPLLKSLAFNFGDFFEYLKKLFLNHTWGLSDSSYPQTVQHFVFEEFSHSFLKFLLIFTLCFCSIGLFMLFEARKREMNKGYSKLSFFLRMDLKRIKRQALLAALPGQALLWSFLAPFTFFLMLFLEFKLGLQGLGNLVKTAGVLEDFPLLYGSLFCSFSFALFLNALFLLIKCVFPRK